MTNPSPSQNPQPSKNALTHGFYAAEVVLPWENQQEFDDLLRAFQNEYCPDGISEKVAVFDLASLHWKKRRLEAGLQQALQQLDFGPTVNTSDPTGDIARAATKSQLVAIEYGCNNLAKQAEQVCKADATTGDSLVIEFEKLTLALAKFNVSCKDLVSSLRGTEKHRRDDIAQAYLPDILERELKIQADIDRRIDKVLKRLVMAKEYKRLYGVISANLNQIVATKLPAKSSH